MGLQCAPVFQLQTAELNKESAHGIILDRDEEDNCTSVSEPRCKTERRLIVAVRIVIIGKGWRHCY